jgi:hypothetical protein
MSTTLLMALLQAAALLTVTLIVFYLHRRTRQLKVQQQRLLSQLKGKQYWRINIARPQYLKTWWRLLPHEATGVLIAEGERLILKGFWHKSGQSVESSFLQSQVSIKWLGNYSLRAGNVYWASLQTPKGTLFLSADTGLNALQSREGLEDIFRGAFPDYELAEEQQTDFALEKNPYALATIVLFFALMAFAAIDTYVVNRYELTDVQILRILSHLLTWLAVLVLGGGIYAMVYRLLTHRQIPARESLALSGLLVTMLLVAALPMAKRVDQILASEPSTEYDYLIEDAVKLVPKDPSLGLPNLRFPRSRDYWAQFPPGAGYKIPFLHGPLGLWQLDHEKFDAPLVAFYEKKTK